MVQRKYLCTAPGQSEWEEKAKALLKSLKGDENERNRVIQMTLTSLRDMNLHQKRSGPGRKSNAERAVSFYEYVLGENAKYAEPSSPKEVEATKTVEDENDRDSDDNKPISEAIGASDSVNVRKLKARHRARHEKKQNVSSDEDSAETMDTTEFLNQHNDLCQVCIVGGELLCCSTCNSVFHLKCVQPKLKEMPADDWSCAYCIVDGVGSHKRKSITWRMNAAAVREMDRLRAEAKELKGVASSEAAPPKSEDAEKVEAPSDAKTPEIKNSAPPKGNEPADPDHASEATSESKKTVAETTHDPTDAKIASQTFDDAACVAKKPEAEDLKESPNMEGHEIKSGSAVNNTSEVTQDKERGGEVLKKGGAGDGNEPHADVKSRKNLELFRLSDLLTPKMKVEPEVNRRRSRRPPAMFNPQDGPDSVWQSEKLAQNRTVEPQKPGNCENPAALVDSASNTDQADDNTVAVVGTRGENTKEVEQFSESATVPKEGTEPIFCNFCKDKNEIPICVFCACRVCYGKHDKSMILLCDQCDDEYHIYCLDPPLSAVPTSKWFCPTCKAAAVAAKETAEETAANPTNPAPETAAVTVPLKVPPKATLKVAHLKNSVVKTSPAKVPPVKSPTPSASPSKAKKDKRKGDTTGEQPIKPKRGRPKKDPNAVKSKEVVSIPAQPVAQPKRRGRPPKNLSSTASPKAPPKAPIKLNADGSIPRKRGRPPKNKNALVSSSPIPKKSRASPPKQQPPAGPVIGKRKYTKSNKESTPSPKKSKQEPQANKSAEKGYISSTSSISSFGPAQTPLKSRSGRTIKRNSFHDEIDEGEQHLRSPTMKVYSKYEPIGHQQSGLTEPLTPAASSKPSKEQSSTNSLDAVLQDASTNAAQDQTQPAAQMVLASSTVTESAKLPNIKAPADTAITNPSVEIVPPVGTSGNSVTATTTVVAAVASSLQVPINAPLSKDSMTTVAAPVDTPEKIVRGTLPLNPPASLKIASTTTEVSIASTAGSQPDTADSLAARRPSHLTTAPGASVPPTKDPPPAAPAAPAAGSFAAASVPAASLDHSSKVPRRKPGARECMQISRRFGEHIIPEKYMETLLDYCTRGKVEHLIRMRERLDEHSLFLEAQLAGLESLVKLKGETDVVVPPMPERFDRSRIEQQHPSGNK